MKPSRPPAPPKPAVAAPPPSDLRVEPWLFTAMFFAAALGFSFVLWQQFPVIPELFAAYWQRDRGYLIPAFPGFFLTWTSNSVITLHLAAYLLVSWEAGRRALRWSLGADPEPLWAVLFSIGLGNGILGTLTLGLGLVGLLDPQVFWTVCLAGVAWAVRSLMRGLPLHRTDLVAPAPGVAEPAAGAAAAGWPGAPVVDRVTGYALAAVVAGCALGLAMAVNRSLLVNYVTLTQGATWMASAAAGVLAWSALVRWIGGTPRVRRAVAWTLAGFAALIVVLNFLPAFEPEWFYDSLVYHLAFPGQWMIRHKIFALEYSFISNYPLLQEMQYTFFLALGNDVAPKLLHWAHGVLVALAVFAAGRTLRGTSTGLVAACIFLSQPTLRFLHHITMVELGLAWFEILATMAILAACGWGSRTERPSGDLVRGGISRRAWVVLAGWFLGFAHGTKYIGLWASVLLLGLWLLEELRTTRPRRPALATLALAVGWASVWTGAWLGKNWLFTGDPIAPILTRFFPALHWDAPLYARWMVDNTKYGTAHAGLLTTLKEVPAFLTLAPAAATQNLRDWLMMPTLASIDVSSFGTFTLNPIPLLFVPCLFAARRAPAPVRALAVYAGIYAVLWATSAQQTRFLYPVVAQAAVPAAFVIVELGAGAWLVRGVLTLAAAWMLFVAAFGEIHNRFSNNALVPYTMGQMDRLGLLHMGVQYYDAVEKANQAVRPRDRLLFVGGDESFYCSRNRICNSIYDRPTLGTMARAAVSGDDLLAKLRRLRVTHLLVYEARCEEYAGYGIFNWGGPAQRRYLDMMGAHGKLVAADKGVFLFELTDRPVPPALRKVGTPSYFYPLDVLTRSRETIGKLDTLFQQKRFPEALVLCDELEKMIPDVTHVHAYRAYALGQVKRVKDSIAEYELAIKDGYPTGVVYYNLALLLENQKKLPRALTMYLAAVELDPGLAHARSQAFEIALALRRFPLALKLGKDVLEANPGDASVRERVRRLEMLDAARHN